MLKPIESAELDAPKYRTPPHNFEAEMGLLGAILVNNRAYEKVSEFLRPEHFANAVHGKIFQACATLIERGQHADPTTLKHFLESDDEYQRAGGHRYLAELASNAVTIINSEHYGTTVHDLYLRRELIDLGTEVVNDAYEGDLDHSAANQIQSAEQALYDLATTGDHEGGFMPFTQALTGAIDVAQAAFHRDGKLAGAATNFKNLDLMLGGLHPSDLIILAGRPSMGKTALATNVGFNVAKVFQAEHLEEGKPRQCVGFFSLEMSAEQLATRILAEEAQIPSDKIRKGEVTAAEFDRIVQASQTIQNAPFYIDDTPGLTVSALRTRARRLKRQHGLGLIVLDYLQLVSGSASKQENRVQEISEITRGLKTLAKELDVPVIALSQLSRAVEQREDKRPQLADLRESGTIEQDSDVVMFVFREEYYEARREPGEGTPEHAEWQARMEDLYQMAELIIAKQRHGPIGRVKLRFTPEFTRFTDAEDPGGDDYDDAPF